ncbi:hypothetical protein CKO15_06155 [Halorhodospira abdelmalekii]|uniref:hypothetical protein n=1 Tax=Halorhodospira abdelmalekii TaxID=421629 RepID=UPI001905969F|nr:hypothetical protein [Halorhodospira abdelmalekii]MBK1734879.1 hypothetical protein [Halorhodospira abdelmalekii]
MGYTHYWHYAQRSLDLERWQQIESFFVELRQQQRVSIEDRSDLRLHGGSGMIAINGCAAHAHDPFKLAYFHGDPKRDQVVQRKRRIGMTSSLRYCKTARKPYDLLVTALLTYSRAIAPDWIEQVQSDGGAEEWEPGRRWAASVAGISLPLPLSKREA